MILDLMLPVIDGLVLVQPTLIADARGFFFESYRRSGFYMPMIRRQLAEKVDVRDRGPIDEPVRLDDVDQAPVGEMRHGEPGQGVERRRIVE